jgi:glycosyltransferase involved in cell wall biosynthesis
VGCLKSFSSLAQKIFTELPGALLIIVGRDKFHHQLLLRSSKEGLSGKILLGKNQKEHLLGQADLLVVANLKPLGEMALEAAQREIPLIVPQNSVATRMLSGSVGVDFADELQLSLEILKILDHKKYRQRTTTNGLQKPKHLTWRSAAQKVRDVYRQAVLGSKKS